MLGWIGRWAASKGMVAVPNLIGLLNTAAQTAITNSGLTYSSSSTTDTGDSGLANKVASQTPTSGTLADYESSVSFVYYNYVPVAPFFPPFFPPTFTPTPSFPFFPPSFPFFPPTFPASPSFPFFPPTFPASPSFPFFPPTFPASPSFPFFPPTFPALTTIYYAWCDENGNSHIESALSNPGQEAEACSSMFVTLDQAGFILYNWECGTTPITSKNCTPPPSFPFFPPTFPFFPPTFPSTPTVINTTYGNCVAFSQCPEGGEQLVTREYSDGTFTYNYECCSYTPTPSFPFFPPTFPALTTIYYAWCDENGNSHIESALSNPGQEAEACSSMFVTLDQAGFILYNWECGTTPITSKNCTPPPSFPFFPPTFPASPSFPFFPPTFPSTPTVINTTYGNCVAFSQCPEGGEQLVTREYSDGTFTYDYECCSYTPTPSFPFFPPTFPASPSFPFFPPTFPASPSFPFFPPTFPASPSFPFFPPTFPASPSFPFFPPTFNSGCPSCYIESNCPSLYCFCSGPCDSDCFC